MRLRAFGALLSFLAFLLSCGSSGRSPSFAVTYQLSRTRTSYNLGPGRDSSRAVEIGYYQLAWRQDADSVNGELRIDSVTFDRDGKRKEIAPARSPITSIGFRIAGNRLTVDSLPTEAGRFPYLATVVLELPWLRPMVAAGRCRPAATWADTIVVGPVPVPGADGLVDTVRIEYRVDSLVHGIASISARGQVFGSGGSLQIHEVRQSTWRLGNGCQGSAESDESSTGALVYSNIGAAPDTVFLRDQGAVRVH